MKPRQAVLVMVVTCTMLRAADLKPSDPGPNLPKKSGVGQSAKTGTGTSGPKGLRSQSPFSQILQQVDPFLGSVADRPVAGKSTFSRYNKHNVDKLLSYDVGNAAVRASTSARGALRSAHIYTGQYHLTGRKLPGYWYGYRYIRFCNNTAFSFKVGGKCTRLDKKGLKQETSLIRGVFPLTAVRIGKLKVRQLVMAPVSGTRRLRALLIVLYVETDDAGGVTATLQMPKLSPAGSKGSGERGIGRFVLLGGLEPRRKGDELTFVVKKDKPVVLPVALAMGEKKGQLDQTVKCIRAAGPGRLISDTVAFFCDPLGTIAIDGKPALIGSIVRRSRHAVMVPLFHDGRGAPLAGPYGSDQHSAGKIWMVDSFYNYLGAGMSRGEYFLDGVRFFLCRSLPKKTSRRWFHRGKYYEDDHRVHSLVNAVAPLVLAGMHYQFTGDGPSLKPIEGIDHDTNRKVNFRARMETLLERILATRGRDEPYLFQTQWISDGPARGRYHTGSNIYVWYAFSSAARILDEVYKEPKPAAVYRDIAEKIARDIRKHCIIRFKGKATFNEGAGLKPIFHDGEQSGTTLAPFLGFCEADDPALLNYKKFAFTADNPQWHKATNSLVWITPDWRVSTFPGFMSDLAAADTEKSLLARLDRLCGLADLDGQWWWWPHHLDEPEKIFRGTWTGKSGWATCVFLTRFINTIMGVSWDAPTKTVAVKPFMPWKKFRYDGLQLGSLRMDYEYERIEKGVRIAIRHNQGRLAKVTITARAPRAATGCKLVKSSAKGKLLRGKAYYARPTWEVVLKNVRARDVAVELRWKQGNN